ncbi:MAG: PstS family phosphate ABC transporter substrate-binding protein [Bacteroidota bacterium]
MKRIDVHLAASLVFFLFGISCNSPEKKGYDDTPTSGSVQILADECHQPLVDVELDTFMKLYKYAIVRPTYLPEQQVFDKLLHNDTFRVAVVSRELNEQEKKHFESISYYPRTTKVAVDALALILNPANPDTQLTYAEVGEMISGSRIFWKKEKGQSADSIRIVFDRSGSANARLLKERFLNEKDFPTNCYALNSNKEVIDYVSKTKGAVGVIGVNWISDRHDPEVESFLSKVKIAEISNPEDSTTTTYYGPYQAYIALKKYPLTRDVYVISREGRNGLGTGFASFFAGDQGQRLVRMCGLLPATMPVRIINIR